MAIVLTKTNAQRREIARLHLEAHLLQQKANQLRREANRLQRRMTGKGVLVAFAVWTGITLGIVIAGSPHQRPLAPLQPVKTPVHECIKEEGCVRSPPPDFHELVPTTTPVPTGLPGYQIA